MFVEDYISCSPYGCFGFRENEYFHILVWMEGGPRPKGLQREICGVLYIYDGVGGGWGNVKALLDSEEYLGCTGMLRKTVEGAIDLKIGVFSGLPKKFYQV